MRVGREACSVATALLLLAVFSPPMASTQTPQGTAFTYQGQLSEGGTPADGTYDFQLVLYDADVGGSQVGPIVTVDDVTVTQGLFTMSVDFGAVFSGSKRWLELSVRPGAGTGGYTPVFPRQGLAPAPTASFSAETPWTGVSGKPPGFADDVDNDTIYDAGVGLDLTGTVFSIADGGVTTPKLAAGAVASPQIADGAIAFADLGQNGCGGSQVIKWNGTAWVCAADANSGGTVTSLTAGPGLPGGTITTVGTVGVSFGSSGAATTVARSDHEHFGHGWVGSGSYGLYVENTSVSTSAIQGFATATSGFGFGVYGVSFSTAGIGVFGAAVGSAGVNYGVYAQSESPLGRGLYANGPLFGVQAQAGSSSGTAVSGSAAIGIEGISNSLSGLGVKGLSVPTSGNTVGVYGISQSTLGIGVRGDAITASQDGTAIGVRGSSTTTAGYGVYGTSANIGVYGTSQTTAGYAGYFQGRVHVTGTLSKGAGSFKIDHPLDPEHKYLYHSFVESPDMKNIYDGVVTTDGAGYAAVELPEWFGALNRDFRYQLTVLDEGDSTGFVQAKVVRKVAENRFAIRTSAPGVEVSWQVTGIRKDRFAEANRIPVEEDKPEAARGTYLHPGAWDQPAEKGLDEARRPEEPIPLADRLGGHAEKP